MDATRIVTSQSEHQARGPLKRVFRALSVVAPPAASWLAERLWFTPPRPAVPTGARTVLATGERLRVSVEGRALAAWTFGRGPPVVLMHGWGGHAGQLVPFIEPLVAAGLRVVAFDAPGHGSSEASRVGVRLATFLDFAAGLRALQEKVGTLYGVVAHSGGAVATGIALRQGLAVERLVLLAPMTRPALYATLFSDALGLDERVTRGWQDRAQRRLGDDWSTFDLTRITPRPEALVIHDREDREVPFADGQALADAWGNVVLHPVFGLGHRRLLRDPEVVARAAAFLTRPSA